MRADGTDGHRVDSTATPTVDQKVASEVQANLRALGLNIAEEEERESVVGPSTVGAVERFQRRHGLPATGQPDPQTRAALAVAASMPAAPDLAVQALQGLAPATTSEGRLVVNETNRRLIIRAGNSVLILSPLETRFLTDDVFAAFKGPFAELERLNYIALPITPTRRTMAVVGLGIWVVIGYAIYGFVNGSALYWLVGGAVIAAVLVIAGYATATGARTFMRWTGELLALALVLGFGIAMPASAIYFTTGVDDLVNRAYFDGELDKSSVDLTLLGRGLQLLFISAVSLLPALLYFLFDRQKLSTLREEFQRHMFRLDPSVRTLSDVRARYGKLMDEVYGTVDESSRGRILPGRRSPILVATIVITLGWLLTLLNPEVNLITSPEGIIELFTPERSAVVFGFLGAYFFALNAILRGYARGDLRPKSYSQITVRIVIVMILAWVLEVVFPDDASYLLVFAFIAGIVPDTALVWLSEYLRARPLGRAEGSLKALAESNPLTRLEGIDLYDRARLLDEGVTNVEGLAHSDLVGLMLQTRIPAPRLVDWTDQAVLYLHAGADTSAVPGNPSLKERAATLDRLRSYGVRTATDLEQAHWGATSRGELDSFLAILPSQTGVPPRLSVIVDTLRDEEWMTNLRWWHDPRHVVEETQEWPPPLSEREEE